MTDDELLHKWINGTISEEELKTFRLRPEYDSLVELYKNTEGLKPPGYDRERMLSEILNQGQQAVSPGNTARRRLLFAWVKYGVAASILVFAGWFFFSGLNNTVKHELAKGERLEAFLPDGSAFVLNAESSLLYDGKKWETDRSLELKGEAFFEVKPGSRFTVNTPAGKIEVLGTSFNVWSRKNTLEVQCQSGKVKVISPEGALIGELLENQAVRFSPGKTPERWQFQATDKAGWITGVSKFRSVSISRVVDELERQFDIEIETGSIKTDEIISCNFPHQDLETALKTALGPLGIQFEIRDKKKVYLYQ